MNIDEQPEETVIENNEQEDAYASVAAAIEEASTASPQEGDAPVLDKAERIRDESGKFSREDDKAKSADKNVDRADATVKPDPAAAQSVKAIPAAVDKAWTPAAKAKWNDLPPEIQAEISRREEEIHRGFTKFDEERVYGKQMKEAATPYMPMLQAEGSSPEVAFKTLLSHAHLLRHGTPQEKFNLWMNTAKTYNIPLPKEFGVTQNQAPNAASIDPNAIVAKVPELVKKEFDNYQQRQEEAQLKAQIDAFASDPAHSHYEKVKPVMAALLSSGQAQDMEDAYKQACWAVPDVRSTLQQSQTNDTEAQRLANIKAKSAAAKKAGSSVAGAPGKSNGAARPANTNPDPYESVAAAFDQMSSG